jgi:hypothetical protein
MKSVDNAHERLWKEFKHLSFEWERVFFWLLDINRDMHQNKCAIPTEVKKSLKQLADIISTESSLPEIEGVLQFFNLHGLAKKNHYSDEFDLTDPITGTNPLFKC